jgi:hypothetical protein
VRAAAAGGVPQQDLQSAVLPFSGFRVDELHAIELVGFGQDTGSSVAGVCSTGHSWSTRSLGDEWCAGCRSFGLQSTAAQLTRMSARLALKVQSGISCVAILLIQCSKH